MAGDDAQYEFKSVQTMRGMEARTMAKLQKDGWEFVTESQGPLLRTKMTFRRVKPKQPWYVWGAGVGALLLLGIIIAVNAISGGDDTQGQATPLTETAVTPSEQPFNEPSKEPTKEPEPSETAGEPQPSDPAETAPEQTLTVKNNKDLAVLLAGTATGGDMVEGFAAKYSGRLIEFDGNIAAMANHGDYKTRYNILISAGDYSESIARGPNFQFKDVNIGTDLHLTGPNIPDTIGRGDNLHIIARVADFNNVQELFFLEPISTEVR